MLSESTSSVQPALSQVPSALTNEIQGHQFALETLQKAFDRKRLHHAYLFHGPEGIGKFRVATVLARLLLCASPLKESNPDQSQDVALNIQHACGQCKSCLRVKPLINKSEGAYHPDLHYITRERDSSGKLAKEIKIAPIRELQSSLSLGSFEGGRVIVIIEDVDRLGLSAANALLKTLEEPLENVHFLLTTSSLNAVLPTIKSRAQSLRFAPLDLKTMQDLLLKVERTQSQNDVEQKDGGEVLSFSPLDEGQRISLAQLSGGSIGRALDLWSQGGMLKVENLIQSSDLSGGPQDILNALAFAKSLESAEEAELKQWIHILRCWYRDALVLMHNPQASELFFPRLTEFSYKRAQVLGLDRLLWRLAALDECENHLFRRIGSNRKLIIETLCLYLAGLDTLTQKALKLS